MTKSSSGRITSVITLTIATVFAGMLGPMQSLVNGRLGAQLSDGHAAALISFGTGLLLMLVIILSREKTQRFLQASGQLIREIFRGGFAGLCGAVIVVSGITVGFSGRHLPNILISGMVISASSATARRWCSIQAGHVRSRVGAVLRFAQRCSSSRPTGQRPI